MTAEAAASVIVGWELPEERDKARLIPRLNKDFPRELTNYMDRETYLSFMSAMEKLFLPLWRALQRIDPYETPPLCACLCANVTNEDDIRDYEDALEACRVDGQDVIEHYTQEFRWRRAGLRVSIQCEVRDKQYVTSTGIKFVESGLWGLLFEFVDQEEDDDHDKEEVSVTVTPSPYINDTAEGEHSDGAADTM